MKKKLLEIKNLKTYFNVNGQQAKAVDDVSFCIYKDEVLGIVGESGSGKSVAAMSLLKLIPNPPGSISGQAIYYDENDNPTDLLSLDYSQIKKYRGKNISMIFQEPMTSLNPVFKIKTQLLETIKVHNPNITEQEAVERAVNMLERVGIPDGKKRLEDYSYQFSGGMRQRIMIAMALLNSPNLVIADEPTTALDVTIQAQVLSLMAEIKNSKETKDNSSILLITHDMAVIAENCDRVIVMYGGKIQEISDIDSIFTNPLHPYTKGLLGSIPTLQSNSRRLKTIDGMVPSIMNLPKGCKFCTRCDDEFYKENKQKCNEVEPELIAKSTGHLVRCHKYYDLEE